jgi:hypothetical protein
MPPGGLGWGSIEWYGNVVEGMWVWDWSGFSTALLPPVVAQQPLYPTLCLEPDNLLLRQQLGLTAAVVLLWLFVARLQISGNPVIAPYLNKMFGIRNGIDQVGPAAQMQGLHAQQQHWPTLGAVVERSWCITWPERGG